MSALRRPGSGGGEAGLSYGGYYVGEPVGHRTLSGAQETAQSWGHVPHPGYYQPQAQNMGNGWGDPNRARIQQEQNYPAYNSGYWNSPVPSRPGYHTTYPVGPEMQSQGMEAYTNGAYGSPYATVPGVINQQYPSIHPTNPFYTSGHPQASYTTEPNSAYKSSIGVPTSNPQWNYTPQQTCHADCPGHRGQVPVYPPFSTHHQASGISSPTYSYGESNHGIPHQIPPQPRLHEENWGQQGTYSMTQPSQQHYWSPASNVSPVAPGNPFVGASTSLWSGNGLTTAYEAKEPSYPTSYSKPEPGTNHSGYYTEPSTQNVRTIQDNKPPPVNPKSHYSASPQLYENGPMKNPVNDDDDQDYGNSSSSDSLGCHPAIQKIVQVLEKVQYLDNEVEEFVGKKTDKAYKCLEELLTKELLELDSVETMGLDSIRQVRKEAVRKLQTILEKLERKGL